MSSIVTNEPSSAEQHVPGPEIMAASSLPGDRVVNAQGDRIGKIIDVMLDVQAGRIAYAVLSYVGTSHADNQWFVVPWDALTLDEEEQDFILDVDRDRPESVPRFEHILDLYKRSAALSRA